MQTVTAMEELIPFKDLPDWALVSRKEILQIFPYRKTALHFMIKKGIFPQGQTLIGKKQGWKVSEVREFLTRLRRGDFEGVQIWERRAGQQNSSRSR